MKARYKILIAAVGATLATGVASQPGGGMNGGTLLSICTNGDALQKGYCIGYVVGFREGRTLDWYVAHQPEPHAEDAMTYDADEISTRPADPCVPPRLPHHQMRDVVIDYILDHPETRYESAGSIIAESLRVAFPCES